MIKHIRYLRIKKKMTCFAFIESFPFFWYFKRKKKKKRRDVLLYFFYHEFPWKYLKEGKPRGWLQKNEDIGGRSILETPCSFHLCQVDMHPSVVTFHAHLLLGYKITKKSLLKTELEEKLNSGIKNRDTTERVEMNQEK